MNPEEQPVNPNDLIVFQNLDNEPFEWQFDAIRTPLPYYIGAGETRELPYYIARHGIEKLIDRMLGKKGVIHTSPIARKELRDQMVLGLKHINHVREKTPNEVLLEEMQRKKDTDPYKELFKAREIRAEQQQKQAAAAQLPPAPLMTTVGTPVAPAAPVYANQPAPIAQPIAPTQPPAVQPVVNTATAVPATEAVIPAADPERQRVYGLLITKLHLDLGHQATKERLDATPVDQIKAEFAADLPEIANPAAAVVPDTAAALSQPGMPEINPNAPLPSQPAPTPAQPVATAPQISMNPQAPAAPILDQQLGLK